MDRPPALTRRMQHSTQVDGNVCALFTDMPRVFISSNLPQCYAQTTIHQFHFREGGVSSFYIKHYFYIRDFRPHVGTNTKSTPEPPGEKSSKSRRALELLERTPTLYPYVSATSHATRTIVLPQPLPPEASARRAYPHLVLPTILVVYPMVGNLRMDNKNLYSAGWAR